MEGVGYLWAVAFFIGYYFWYGFFIDVFDEMVPSHMRDSLLMSTLSIVVVWLGWPLVFGGLLVLIYSP